MPSRECYIIAISLLLPHVSSTAPQRHLQWQIMDNEEIGNHQIPWYLDTGFVVGYKTNPEHTEDDPNYDIYVLNDADRYKFNTKHQFFTELESGTERNWDYDDPPMKPQAYTQVGDQMYFAGINIFDLSTETLSALPYSTTLDSSFSCLTSNVLEVPSSVSSQDTTFYGSPLTQDLLQQLGFGNASDASLNTYRFLYTTGGASSTALSAQFYIWNLGTNKILRGPDMPSARQEHSSVVVNDTLYVIGGNTGTTVSKVKMDSIIYIDISDMSDISSWQWIELDEKLSVARAGLRSIVFEHWIYVVGGYNSESTDPVDNVDIIDTRDGTVIPEVPLYLPVAFGGAINVGDRIYVFGGSKSHCTDVDSEDGIGEDILQFALLPIDLPPPNSVISSTVTTVYFVLNAICIILLTVYVYMTSEDKKLKSLAKAIWARKGIYLEVLAHLLDTACDLGVLVDWWLLAHDGFGYALDMEAMFWAAIVCQIWYRTMMCCFAYATPAGVNRAEEPTFCVDAPLACFDMYIIKTVYESFKSDDTESNARQNSIQLLEAMLESCPQIIFQGVFLARAYGTILGDQGNVGLAVISILSSIFSVSSKYGALDKPVVVEEAQSANWKLKWPCVSFKYVLRTLWRSSYIIARVLLMVLIWVVIGTQAFAIYFGTMTMIWFILMCCVPSDNASIKYFLLCVVCFAIPSTRSTNVNCYRAFEMVLFMIVVTVFYSSETICDGLGAFCDRYRSVSGDGNTVTQLLLVAAWLLMITDFILFFVIRKMGILVEEFTMTDIFMLFIEGQELDPTVQHGKTKSPDSKKVDVESPGEDLEVAAETDTKTKGKKKKKKKGKKKKEVTI